MESAVFEADAKCLMLVIAQFSLSIIYQPGEKARDPLVECEVFIFQLFELKHVKESC